ncbi:prenyltransferase [Candidatus Dojkabacteria bacterium]|uniref:Prenyltransferase n=1 Tax=Candidatus Dojkabacteria bacterium TaxID=2099670 RepID=A0A955L0V1_9BACT|nr:prenyltransferase [Candidatus Dojkabacteria bacterium]
MKNNRLLNFFYKTSRPKFWSYLFGTFLFGFFAGLQEPNPLALLDWKFLLLLIFFIFPANLFVYGVNDLADEDTDKFNPKKGKQENLLEKSFRKYLFYGVIVVVILSLIIAYAIPQIALWLIGFMILGGSYSLPPARFKKRPFIDSLSNIFYAFPGIIGFLINTPTLPSLQIIPILFIFPVAMHLYSAIPDIEADKKAGLKTTAVILGKNISLIVCNILWLAAFLWILNSGYLFPFTLLLIVYPTLPLLNLNLKKFDINKTYWFFPYINFIIGFIFSIIFVINLYR